MDKDGFPRDDIDIFSVRAKRNRLAVISNDHKAIMLKIEACLLKLHEEIVPMDANFSLRKTNTSDIIENIPVPEESIRLENSVVALDLLLLPLATVEGGFKHNTSFRFIFLHNFWYYKL